MSAVVYFDESGNTGQDLLNRDQPVFTLASVHFAPEVEAELGAIFAGVRAAELKYSALKRNSRGQQMVLDFLRHAAVTSETVKVALINKRYMLYAKLVDTVHEPLAHTSGLNLYDRKGALAMANLFWGVYPVFVDNATLDRFLADFVTIFRGPSPAAYRMLKASALSVQRRLESHPTGAEIAASLAPVLIACEGGNDFFAGHTSTELDPLVPSYHHLCDAWGKTLRTSFVIDADESKTLARTKPLLMKFSDPNLVEHHQDYYGEGYSYPLQVSDITAVSSDGSRGVQLADIVAGAHAQFGGRLSQRAPLDPYVAALRDVILDKGFPVMALWPSSDVTPQALGADGPMPSDPVEYAARILSGDPTTRRPGSA